MKCKFQNIKILVLDGDPKWDEGKWTRKEFDTKSQALSFAKDYMKKH